MFIIEKNIPIPEIAVQNKWAVFEKMEVGDSFLVTGMKENTIRQNIYRYQQRLGYTFACVKADEDFRVFRVK